MINYIPGYREEYLDLVKSNPLYEEILERRAYFDCDTCECHNEANQEERCQKCLHKMKFDSIEIRDYFDRRLKVQEKTPARMGLFGCSCRRGWTGLVSMYFQRSNKVLVGDAYAKFCPICGKEYIKEDL